MRSTFYGLEIAKTGLFTSQTQLDITGHNMSNASTVGYTRQRVVTEALPPGVGNKFIAEDIKSTAGRGVSTVIIDQVRNPFLDYQYRKEHTAASRLETKEQYFEYVESLFNNELDEMDKSTGITNIFKGFYSSLYALSEAPADREMRANVKQSAIKLTETMNYYFNKLVEQQNTLNLSVQITATEINDIASQIADLNKQIYAFESPYDVQSSDGTTTFVYKKANANDLRDKRNVLLDQLSGILKIDITEDRYGRVDVKIGDTLLVDKNETNKLVAVKDQPNNIQGENDLFRIYWDKDIAQKTTDANGVITGVTLIAEADRGESDGLLKVDRLEDGGSLKGYLEIRDGVKDTGASGEINNKVGIPYVVKMLDKVVAKIVKDVNSVHKTGWTMPQGNTASRNDLNFFADAEVNATWGTDVNAEANKGNLASLSWSGFTAAGSFTIEKGDNDGEIKISGGDLPAPIVKTIYPGTGRLDLTNEGLGVITWKQGDTSVDAKGIADLIAAAGTLTTTVSNAQFLTAKNMKLSDNIMMENGEWNIAASDMPINMNDTNSQQGNNKVALQLCSLITKTNLDGTPDNLNSAYKEMLNTISLELKSIRTTTDTQVLMRAHLEEQRKSISDVSIDEEMTNLVRFNHAYKAASRVITTMDEGLDTIINKMGTVGR